MIPFGDERVYGVCVAEKGVFRFKLVADGVAGHASMPKMGDNALLKLAPLIERLGAASAEANDVTAASSRAGEARRAGAHRAARGGRSAAGGDRRADAGGDVRADEGARQRQDQRAPSRAEVSVDCRVPPGLGRDAAERRIVEVLGRRSQRFRLEFTEQVAGNASALESPLMEMIAAGSGRRIRARASCRRSFRASPTRATWRADVSRLRRLRVLPAEAHDLYESAPLVHGADERIDVRDVGFAAQFYGDVTRALLG